MDDMPTQRAESFMDRKGTLLIALAVGAFALLLYIATLCPFAYPGLPARYAVEAAGLQPRLDAMHPGWMSVAWLAARLPVGGLAARLGVLSAVCGALTVGCLAALVAQLVGAILRGSHDPALIRRAGSSAALAGALAGLYLAFSKPFWMVCTRPHVGAFDLLLLLLASWAFVRFALPGGSERWLYLSSFLAGVACVEYPTVAVFVPLFAVLAVFVLSHRERLRPRTVLTAAGWALAGLSGYLLASWQFCQTDGFVLGEYDGFLHVLATFWRGQAGLLMRSLPRVGWLLVLIVAVVPWLTCLAVARGTLAAQEPNWHRHLLHLVLGALAVAVLLDVRFAPYAFAGRSNLLVLPYALSGMVFGYAATYWRLLPLVGAGIGFSAAGTAVRRWIGAVLAGAMTLALAGAAWMNWRDVDWRDARVLRLAAQQTVSALDGRDWLVTEGAFDHQILVEAHDRGVKLRLLNLRMADRDAYVRHIGSQLGSARLRNLSRVHLLPMLEEWLKTDPQADRRVALLTLPELWTESGRVAVPSRVLFLGAAKDAVPDAERLVADHEAFWREALPALERCAAGVGSPPAAEMWRRHLGLVANNLGVFLLDAGRREQAFSAFERARQVSPENISALLNQSLMVEAGYPAESAAKIRDEVKALVRGAAGRPRIWSLARSYGFVRDPQAFCQLGLAWALSGRPAMAVSGLESALSLLPDGQKGAVREMLAWALWDGNQREEGEAIFRDLAKRDPGNPRAHVGLARAAAMRGDFGQAKAHLLSAQKAGADRVLMTLELASLHLLAGEADAAAVAAEEALRLKPGLPKAWQLLLGSVLRSGSQERLANLVRRMEQDARELRHLVALAQGYLHVAERRWSQARGAFQRSVDAMSRNPPAFEMLLRLDVLEGAPSDAARHARDLLRLDPEHPFGNYILGTLLLKDGQFDLAEDAFRKSLQGQVTPHVQNDLAWTLKERREYAEAETLARASLASDARSHHAWDTLGVILLETGRPQEAVQALEKALSIRPGDPVLILHMADVQRRLGDRARVRELLGSLSEVRRRMPEADQARMLEMERWARE